MLDNFRSCNKCLYDNYHPFGLNLDENGSCSGCEIHNEKLSLDWNKRFNDLLEIVRPYRSQSNYYDCIVPVDGNPESFFILDIVKNKLKLNPLMVHYNSYFNTNFGIYNLARLQSLFDSELLIKNVNLNSVKKITKTTIKLLKSIYWHVIAGKTIYPVQVAVLNKIPLVIWGSHQALEQVGMYSHNDNVEMTRRFRKEHDLMGYDADDLLKLSEPLQEVDIFQYRYPEFSDIAKIGIRGIYLGNFILWDHKKHSYEMIKKYDCKVKFHERTPFTYEYSDCFNYMNLHDWIKFKKLGYSKVTDQLCREIRFGRLSRDKALEIKIQYEGKRPQYLKLFCDWLGISPEGLNYLFKTSFFDDSTNSYLVDDNLNIPNSGVSPDLVKKDNSCSKYILYGKGLYI